MRRTGISGLERHLDQTNNYSTLSTSISQQQTATLTAQLSTFQTSLSTFSSRHRQKILSSPEFRQHFSALCAEVGVDPLGGGAKGIWDKFGVGDWYYALGVQIVDVCLRARERGGGLVALDEVIQAVTVLRNGGSKAKVNPANAISETDVKTALESLKPLGCGYALIEVSGKKVVQCSPGGMDRDSMIVVEIAGTTGRGSVRLDEVYEKKRIEGWSLERAERAVEKALLQDGMVWIDDQGNGGATTEYWVPALFEFN